MKLTDAQREFASENHNLIYWFMQKKGLSIEEWYGAVAIGYVKAVATFDQEKANFSTYAYRCMSNQVGQERRKLPAPCISLNEIARNDENGSCAELQEFIADTFDYAVDVEPLVDAESGLNRLPDKMREILLMKYAGFKEIEIARHFSVSRAYINRIANSARDKMRMLA